MGALTQYAAAKSKKRNIPTSGLGGGGGGRGSRLSAMQNAITRANPNAPRSMNFKPVKGTGTVSGAFTGATYGPPDLSGSSLTQGNTDKPVGTGASLSSPVHDALTVDKSVRAVKPFSVTSASARGSGLSDMLAKASKRGTRSSRY